MLISHEVPRSLLKESLYFNDYDYFLIHLYKKYDEYQEFYKLSQSHNRLKILDNSACELRGKEEFNFDEFANYVEQLKPDEYIIPDVFNNYEKNMEYFEKWMKNYKDLPGKKIVALHGQTDEELINSYKYFQNFDVKIAINYDECIYTQHNIISNNISMNKMLNRINFIYKLIYTGVLNKNKKHHLLGCHLPQEFALYKTYDWIETIDTSNPIMCALEGIKYNENGVLHKPKINIDNSQDIIITDEIKFNIIENVKKFRFFCERC